MSKTENLMITKSYLVDLVNDPSFTTFRLKNRARAVIAIYGNHIQLHPVGSDKANRLIENMGLSRTDLLKVFDTPVIRHFIGTQPNIVVEGVRSNIKIKTTINGKQYKLVEVDYGEEQGKESGIKGRADVNDSDLSKASRKDSSINVPPASIFPNNDELNSSEIETFIPPTNNPDDPFGLYTDSIPDDAIKVIKNVENADPTFLELTDNTDNNGIISDDSVKSSDSGSGELKDIESSDKKEDSGKASADKKEAKSKSSDKKEAKSKSSDKKEDSGKESKSSDKKEDSGKESKSEE